MISQFKVCKYIETCILLETYPNPGLGLYGPQD